MSMNNFEKPVDSLILDSEILADQVRSRLCKLQNPATGQLVHSRFLKAGQFRQTPLEIVAHQRLQKSREAYLHPDQLAHSLSICASKLPAACFAKIRKIVLVPELVYTTEYLLSHLFFPEDGILAFYLYPRRMNDPGAGHPLQFKMTSETVPRLTDYLPARVSHAGLLEQVLRTIGELSDTNLVQKFLLLQSELQSGELFILQSCAERYNLISDV